MRMIKHKKLLILNQQGIKMIIKERLKLVNPDRRKQLLEAIWVKAIDDLSYFYDNPNAEYDDSMMLAIDELNEIDEVGI